MAQYTLADIKNGKAEAKSYLSIPIVISKVVKKRSRKDKIYGTLIIEDCTSRMEATVFSKVWAKYENELEEGVVTILKCRVDKEIVEDKDGNITPIVRLSVQNVRKVSGDSSSMIKDLSLKLKDGTLVTFKIPKEQNVTAWQRASSYISNIKRMG
jgi:DNA polymerase III alpha subunit